MAYAPSETLAESAFYLIYVGAIFIPSSYLHFILALLDQQRSSRVLWVAGYLIAIAQLCLLAGCLLIEGVKGNPTIGFYEVPTRLYWLYVANYIVLPSYAFFKLVVAFRQTYAVVKRNQFKYAIYSSMIGFLCGGTSFFPFFTSLRPPFASPVVYCSILPFAYDVSHRRCTDDELFLSRA